MLRKPRYWPRRVTSEAATEDPGAVATVDSALPQPITSHRSLITRNQGYGGLGRGCGVGRGLGVTLGVTVGVAVGVTLGVGVVEGVGVGVGATGTMAYAWVAPS
jgi:hypothetical protein